MAVAGRFYPADPQSLQRLVRQLLDSARSSIQSDAAAGREGVPPPATLGRPGTGCGPPRALIVPHAGYLYSGAIAASGYARLGGMRGQVSRVLLLGPAHHVAFRGLAASGASAFAFPGAELPVQALPPATASELGIAVNDRAHKPEHCLEVQLPFLAEVLGDVAIIPLLTGTVRPAQVAHALAKLWNDDSLVIVTSDLSHYLHADDARRRDRMTAAAIERLDWEAVGPHDACGRTAVQGLLLAAHDRRLQARCVDLRNSGDTGGGCAEVVGYGAFIFSDLFSVRRYGASPHAAS